MTSNTVAHSVALRLSVGPVSDFTIEAIRAIPLIDVAGAVTSLRRRGSRLVGLCPLHKEKHPSFGINVEKNLWYCFGCNAGGDVISFIRELERCDFKTAVRILGARYGIEVRHGVLDLERMAWRSELTTVNARIKQIERAEQIRVAKILDEYRKQIRAYRNVDEVPCGLFDRLRRADARYVLSVLADEEDRLEFLSSTPAEQDRRIDEVLMDGYFLKWELPLQ
jgi:hypothetical protein